LVPVTVAPTMNTPMVVKLTLSGRMTMRMKASSVDDVVSLVRGL
jgi:hypothetical protein